MQPLPGSVALRGTGVESPSSTPHGGFPTSGVSIQTGYRRHVVTKAQRAPLPLPSAGQCAGQGLSTGPGVLPPGEGLSSEATARGWSSGGLCPKLLGVYFKRDISDLLPLALSFFLKPEVAGDGCPTLSDGPPSCPPSALGDTPPPAPAQGTWVCFLCVPCLFLSSS